MRAPIKADKVSRMQESYNEDLASHIGPESCAFAGNSLGEALTGVRTGILLSPEKTGNQPSADAVQERRRPHRVYRQGKTDTDLAGSETYGMYVNTLYGNRESLYLFRPQSGSQEESQMGVRS